MTKVGGVSSLDSAFRFVRTDRLDVEHALDVLRGELAGVVVKEFFPAKHASAIASRFWTSQPQSRSVGGSADYIGTFAYNKELARYLELAEESRARVLGVLGDEDPHRRLLHELTAGLATKDIQLRPAQHEGRLSSHCVIRSYQDPVDGFVLLPHEDEAMLDAPWQQGFEIQGVASYTVCALNLCLEAAAGCELICWNVRPGPEERNRFGTTHTGDFYPVSGLAGISHQVVPLAPGDACLFDARHVHALTAATDPAQRRTTISCFMGFRDPTTVITWA